MMGDELAPEAHPDDGPADRSEPEAAPPEDVETQGSEDAEAEGSEDAEAEDAEGSQDADPSEEAEPAAQLPEDAESGAGDAGSPGIPPARRDERADADGVVQSTTTGDPEKDFRGPSVTEEARRHLEDDPAMDEPGYADLGHAEDGRILRDR